MSYLYRGVHAKHPQIAAARNGVAIPGDPDGVITPKQHNAGGVSAISPYTSWSRRIDVARLHAFGDGLQGIILRATTSDPLPVDTWHWVESPNEFDEAEVLLFGIRMNLEVIEP